MLTLNQVIKLYEDGLEIKFENRWKKDGRKGDYNPPELEVLIYKLNIESIIDRDITILHELIHARDEIKGKRYRNKTQDEKQVEKEARETYRKNPYIIKFIKDLYKIK